MNVRNAENVAKNNVSKSRGYLLLSAYYAPKWTR